MKVRRWISILVVFAPAAGPVLALPAVQTGLLGLARGETARVTVINLASQSPEAPPSPCVVNLGFRDENGRLFLNQSGAPLQKESRLETGEAATLALPAGLAFSDTRSLRRPFRAVVEASPEVPDVPPNPCDRLATTLEILRQPDGRAVRLGEPGLARNRDQSPARQPLPSGFSVSRGSRTHSSPSSTSRTSGMRLPLPAT